METYLILLSTSTVVLLAAVLFFLYKQNRYNQILNSDDKQKQFQQDFENFKNSVNAQMLNMTGSFNTLSQGVTRDTTKTLTQVDEKINQFNQSVEEINKKQQEFSKVLSGVKKYGTLAEYSLESLIKDLLPPNQYIANAKMRPEEDRTKVEFAVKLQNDVLCPIDSHWPIEKLKAVEDAFNSQDKKMLADARSKLASAIRIKARKIMDLYISPPKTTDFAILYLPTEGLYSELTSYADPETKILLIEELRQKYKITLAGPNVLCSMIQAFHLGFQTLKIQKHAKQIYIDLTKISSRFEKHFMGVAQLRTHLQDALDEVDNFGKDARSIKNTLENIKDPDNVKESLQKNPEKVKVIK